MLNMSDILTTSYIVNVSDVVNMSDVLNMSNVENMSDVMNMNDVVNMSDVMTPSPVVKACEYENTLRPGDPPTPRPLVLFTLVHCYIVMLLGGIVSGVAVWCIATCGKTRVAVKVLLLAVFVPVLLVCVVTKPLMGQMVLALLFCDPSFIPYPLQGILVFMFTFLTQVELMAIAVVAVVRTVALWSPHRHELGLNTAIAIVVCVIAYCATTSCVVCLRLVLQWEVDEVLERVLTTVAILLGLLLPCLITASCYIAMFIAVRHSKRRLGQSQQHGGVSDQATRAMLAVFISNFTCVLPHSVTPLFGLPPLYLELALYILFWTHCVVDPMVFVWFNSSYRERILGGVKGFVHRCHSASAKFTLTPLPLSQPPSTSSYTTKEDTTMSSAAESEMAR